MCGRIKLVGPSKERDQKLPRFHALTRLGLPPFQGRSKVYEPTTTAWTLITDSYLLPSYPFQRSRSREMRINACSRRRGSPLRLSLLHNLNDLLRRGELLRLGRVLDKIELPLG